jgi:hypothetical protein
MTGLAPLNMADLGNLVRHWVYYDGQVSHFNKHAASARASRDQYEGQILDSLQRARYETAVIQIAGGRILVNEEKKTQSLTFKVLEDLLHEYFRQRPGPFQDETANILKFIKGHRQVENVKRLKKVMAPPSVAQQPAQQPAQLDGSKPEGH